MNRSGPILEDSRYLIKLILDRCIVLKSFLKDASITVKKKLTDSIINSSRSAAVHDYLNLRYVVST